MIIWLRALRDQQFPRYLKLQQKETNVRVLTNNNNGVLVNVARDSGAFAKWCAWHFNDMPIIMLSSCKVKQYLLDKAPAKYFTE